MNKINFVLAIVFFILAVTCKDKNDFLYMCIAFVFFLIGSLNWGTKKKSKGMYE